MNTVIKDEIIPLYENFLRQDVSIVVVFSQEQFECINAFAEIYLLPKIKYLAVDMMMENQLFEMMKKKYV